MIQTDYTYYKDKYFGDLVDKDEFPKLLKRAEAYVRARTFGNADSVSEDSVEANTLRDCLCSVVDIIKAHTGDDGTKHGTVTSESVGGSWSRSFKSSNNNESFEDIVYNDIYVYLSGTDLLYGGVTL